jgi:hypothetical protein
MATITIDQHYVEQFSANVRMLAEQQMSRLISYVDTESVTGEAVAVDRMGTIGDPEQVTSLYQDTNLSEAAFDRRWYFPIDYNLGSLIDKVSTVRMLYDPASRLTRRHAGSFGRLLDQTIINALIGNAYVGKRQGELVNTALPAEQQLVAATINGAAGLMSIEVLRAVLELFQMNEHMDSGTGGSVAPICAVMSPKMITRHLLATTEVTSADYNTIKTLVNGEVNTFMGFDFVMHNGLPNLGTETATAIFFQKQDAATLGWTMPIGATQSNRPDKRNIPQILTEGGWGATRVEDTMVVTVTVDETA